MLRSSLLLLACWISGARAQQNFFNVPSGQLTPAGKYFYQHQVNGYGGGKVLSKQHLVFGLRDEAELGLNFVNVAVGESGNRGRVPHRDIVNLTGQKSWTVNRDWRLNAGFQLGAGKEGRRPRWGPANSVYALSSYQPLDRHLILTAGSWLTDQGLLGPGRSGGAMAGVEWQVRDRWYVMADWVDGNSENAAAVIGGMVDLDQGVQLCFGAQVPGASRAKRALVLELNVFNY